jgi:uncharacterized protein (DUF302 family)
MKTRITKTFDLTFEKAVARITEEMKKEGFGILTSIDVRDTLKNKINVEFKKYSILGACNPHFAHEALTSDDEAGLFLPCNVIVYEKGDKTVISIFNPDLMADCMHNKSLTRLSKEVKAKLEKALSSVS